MPSPRPATVRRSVLAVAAVWAGALAVNRSLRRVQGPSMLPTLAPGDLVLTRPLLPSVGTGLPDRGDLAVVTVDGVTAIKRVVGLPGDSVVLGDGHLHVDGSWWQVRGGIVDEDHRWEVGADQVVVLGDNRNWSTDSRKVGPIPLSDVSHVVLAGVTPLQRLGAGIGMLRLPGPRRREAVRVVVLGPDDRTLLFRVRDHDGGSQRWWETPGGGLLPGESLTAAARRELDEEVGTPHGEVVDLDHVDRRLSTYAGTEVERIEHTMATRVATTEVSTANWTAAEHHDQVGWEWFTRDEVASLEDSTIPATLPRLMDRAIAALAA